MKKNSNFIPCILAILITHAAIAQELQILNSGTLYVSSKGSLHVNNDIQVTATGNLIISSDVSNSGSLIVTGNTAGDITYERHIPTDKFHLVSAPVANQNIETFFNNAANDISTSGTGNYGISEYVNTNDQGLRWQYYNTSSIGAADSFTNGKGYSNKRDAAGLYSFKGAMASEDVSFLMTAPGTHNWNSLGNPFPSFLTINTLAQNTTSANSNLLADNIDNLDTNFSALYLWDGTAYIPFNLSSTVAASLAPGQAFMVNAKSDNTLFTFKETTQTNGLLTPQLFYKAASTATPEIIVRLSNGSQVKNTTLKFFDTTTKGLDKGYDAGTFASDANAFSLDTHLVSNSEGINFTLQCLPIADFKETAVSLAVTAPANQTLSFSAAALNLPEDVNVFLEDKDTHTVTNITNATYSTTTTAALNGIGRFYISSSENVLSTEDATAFNGFTMYTTNNTNLRIAGSQQKGTATVALYSILGTKIATYSFKMEAINDIALPKNLATGVYIVQLIAAGAKQTKKIIIE